MEEKRSMLLKVTGIIMLIGGILSAILSLVGAVGICTIQVVPEASKAVDEAAKAAGTSSGPIMGVFWVGVVFAIISSVIEIIAGVTGIKNWQNPAAYKKMLILGIIVIVISLLGNILSGIGSGNFGSYIFSIILGLILPVLYLIGVFQLKGQE